MYRPIHRRQPTPQRVPIGRPPNRQTPPPYGRQVGHLTCPIRPLRSSAVHNHTAIRRSNSDNNARKRQNGKTHVVARGRTDSRSPRPKRSDRPTLPAQLAPNRPTPSFALPTIGPSNNRASIALSQLLTRNGHIILCFCPTTVAPNYAARTYSFHSGVTQLATLNFAILNISGSPVSGLRHFHRHSRLSFPLLSSTSLAIRQLCNTCNRGGLCKHARVNIVHSAFIVDISIANTTNAVRVTHCGIQTGNRITSLVGTLR